MEYGLWRIAGLSAFVLKVTKYHAHILLLTLRCYESFERPSYFNVTLRHFGVRYVRVTYPAIFRCLFTVIVL